MASRAKFYDGESAQVHEVSVRPSASELIVYRPTDLVVLARWPLDLLASTSKRRPAE